TFGAWLVWALAASVLTASTLAWNPIRALVGRTPPVAAESAPDADRPRRKRDKNAPETSDADRALALAPSFDEMPAIDTMAPVDDSKLDADDALAETKKRKKRSKAEAAADRDAEIAAEID